MGLEDGTKKLGFGMMRLPKKDGKIEIETVKGMVDTFMAAGFTYFDTAWAYEGSEDAVRQALVERYPRDSYTIATKNAAWIHCETKEDAEAQFETSLKRLGVDYVDFYLLHNLGDSRIETFEKFDMWTFIRKKKEEGKIRHIGFSFHDKPEVLEQVMTKHPEAEFVQLQINYADWENEDIQSRGVYETARRFGKPVVIMEPVKGGLLAAPPKSVSEIFREAEPDMSESSWAVRFAASLPGVITVLSGMSTPEQVEDNISYMKDFTGLSEAEREVVERARKALEEIPIIPCTSCDYCAKVCPQKVGISGTFSSMNMYLRFGNLQRARDRQEWQIDRKGRTRAASCVKCGKCESVCPQHIAIRDQLDRARAVLGDQE